MTAVRIVSVMFKMVLKTKQQMLIFLVILG